MNWLARLKAENSSPTHATNATTGQNVAFVACISEDISKYQADSATFQPKHASSLVQTSAKATNATNTPSVAFVAPPSEAIKVTVQADPNLWCWPHSSAMNTQEISTLIMRLDQFTRKGVSNTEAERLADQLVLRDRDEDDRHLCVECHHLQGDVGRWSCANAHAARMAVGVANAPLPGGLTQQLQRCPGFTPTPLLKGI